MDSENSKIYEEKVVVTQANGPSPKKQGVRIVYFFLDLIEILLILRFALRALGANPLNGFVSFIYSLTLPLIKPFTGIFAIPAASVGPSVIEWATVFAAIIYALIAYIIVRLIRLA